ncbi:MAG: hypothetical protein HFH36_13610 [Lachnospiraceae bacterium]|nr:hypothetical protein [Lachnospiraceae bacterium]MCI9448374.1 hypothetical protein [Lachnospiraceae bacterium]
MERIGGRMLKIVGTNGKHVTNEKILIDDKNKLTKYGVIIILLDVLADIGFFFVMSRVVKTLKKRKE